MATFLELARKTARESGTVASLPESVTGQSGRLESIVGWTADAWVTIQNEQASWRWLEGEFESVTQEAVQRYTAASFGLSRFAEWHRPDTLGTGLFCYDADKGLGDESAISYRPWEEFYRTTMRGIQPTGKPGIYSASPTRQLVLYPVPDKAYVIRGLYRKSPQVLAANSDTPECPARFHDIIVWRALIYLAEYDEAITQDPRWRLRFKELLGNLERDQLPQMRIAAGPLA